MKNNFSIVCQLLLFFLPFMSGMQPQTTPAATAAQVQEAFYKQHGNILSHISKVDILPPSNLSQYGRDKNLRGQDVSEQYYSNNYGIAKATAVALENYLQAKGHLQDFVKVYKAAEAQYKPGGPSLDGLINGYINGSVNLNISAPATRSQIRPQVVQTQQPVQFQQQQKQSLAPQVPSSTSSLLQQNPQIKGQSTVAMQSKQEVVSSGQEVIPQRQSQSSILTSQKQVQRGAQHSILNSIQGKPLIGQQQAFQQRPGVTIGGQVAQTQRTKADTVKPLKSFWTRSFVSYVPGGAELEKKVDIGVKTIGQSVGGFAERALTKVSFGESEGKKYTLLHAVNDILAFPGVRFALELTIFGPLGQKDDIKLRQFIMITLTTFYNQFKLTMTPVGALNMAVTKYLLPFKVMKAVLPAKIAQRASLQVHTLMVHSLTVFNQYLANGGDLSQAITNHGVVMLLGNAGRIASTGARVVGGVASGVTSGVTSGIKRFGGGLKSFFIRGKK